MEISRDAADVCSGLNRNKNEISALKQKAALLCYRKAFAKTKCKAGSMLAGQQNSDCERVNGRSQTPKQNSCLNTNATSNGCMYLRRPAVHVEPFQISSVRAQQDPPHTARQRGLLCEKLHVFLGFSQLVALAMRACTDDQHSL